MYLRGLALSLSRFTAPPEKLFRFEQKTYNYFSHSYNLTWMNERYVEVAIGLKEMERRDPSQILEVGNVLSHYQANAQHTVIDKYEKGNSNVTNVDALEFRPGRKYDFIVSLSTFEHVGWDEMPKEPGKSWKTIKHLSSLLSGSGEFLFTIPSGYHPQLDKDVHLHQAQLGPLRAMRRISAANGWIQCSPEEAATLKFGKPYPFANAIYIGRVSSPL